MAENIIGDVLGKFSQSLKEETFDYYNRCYSYIKDLFADKQIDLNFKTAYENERNVKETVELMIKTVRLALNTIGVSKSRLSKGEEKFKEIATKKGDNYPNYDSYFEKDLKAFVDKNLFEIILEYLIDWDTNKIENLDLFDLLPRNFIDSLDKFKEDYITSTKIKSVINHEISEIDKYINPSNLIIQVKTTIIEEPTPTKVDVLKEIESVKEMNIEALKMSIKKSAQPAIPEVSAEETSTTPVISPTEEVAPTPAVEPAIEPAIEPAVEPPIEKKNRVIS